jgi:iron complex outermembrane receptor protein
VYNPDGSPPNGDCKANSFTTLDLTGRFDLSERIRITGSVLNAAHHKAPFDPYTYGGTNYNPAFNQQGAIGRFITVGARYSF